MSYKACDQLSLTAYIQENQRQQDINIWGALQSLQTAAKLSLIGGPLNVTKGIGKILFVVNAGTDLVGDITVTGNSINRDTGATSVADTDTVTLNGTTTDSSTTDSGGFTVPIFTGAYITSKWFYGTLVTPIVLTTLNVDVTDMDIYHVSFHQFDDVSNITVNTLDISALPVNASAALYAHLYSVKPTTGDLVDVTNEMDIELDTAEVESNNYQRLRRSGSTNEFDIDGATQGVFLQMFLDRNNQNDWQDISIFCNAEQRLAT